MSYTSSVSSISSNPIIGYKNKMRYTPVDYRELFALKAEQIGQLSKLSSDIEEYEDFTRIMICLINILIKLKHKQKQVNRDEESSMSLDSSSDSDSTLDSDSSSMSNSYSNSSRSSSSTNTNSDSLISSMSTSTSDSDFKSIDTTNLFNDEEERETKNDYGNIIHKFSIIMGISMIELDNLLCQILDLTAI